MRQVLASALIVVLFAGCAPETDVVDFSNHTLSDMRPIVEVVEYFYANPPNDKSVTEKLEFVVYSKVLELRSAAPNVAHLNGTSIKGLCAAISVSRHADFGKAVADEDVTKLVKGYLGSIEPVVKAKAGVLKKTIFAEDDCAI